MKVVLINFSGNVGKSTLAANLLSSRMKNPQKFEVESLNAGGDPEALQIKGNHFGKLIKSVMMAEDAIIDVGASNVEDFIGLMQQYEDSHEEFDYFVVPVVKEKKQQNDTINTLTALNNIGIPASKIRVVFNKVDRDETPEDEFASIVGYHKATGHFSYKPQAVVYENEVYELLGGTGKSLHEVVTDPVDYREKLRTLTDEDEREECVKMVGIKRLGATATKNLDATFKALFA